jgi:F0F1-type ATP synthase delta subunit
MKKPVHIRQILDPSLVGGFSVRCGAEVTDMSAEAQLKALSGAMKKKMAFSIKI